jgi:hypothetical protein
MSGQGEGFRNRPEEDLTTRRTAEDELMRGDHGDRGDRGVGRTGDGSAGGSGTAGGGLENEGSGSLLISEADDAATENDGTTSDMPTGDEGAGSRSGVQKGGAQRQTQPATKQDKAAGGEEDENAREGYEDQGSSRDADGTQGESSGSRPGYH